MSRHIAALAVVVLVAVSGALGAGAQTPTPPPAESPFQTVEVDRYAYQLDPYYPCIAVLRRRDTELTPEQGPVTVIYMQLFVRDRQGQMQDVQDEPFPMTESENTAQAEVGDAFPCDLQIAATAMEDLDG